MKEAPWYARNRPSEDKLVGTGMGRNEEVEGALG